MPSKIVAAGHLNSDGIEESISATLLYSGKVKIIVISKTFFDFHIYKYSYSWPYIKLSSKFESQRKLGS